MLYLQVDLPTALGMDMIHCEREAKLAIEQSKGALQLIRGEVIMESYFDSLAAEVQETLQVSYSLPKLSMSSGNIIMHGTVSMSNKSVAATTVRCCCREA